MIRLPKIVPAPEKLPANLPKSVNWLAGEGAGSWFLIEKTLVENQFTVSRFSPEGTLECSGVFSTDTPFDLNDTYHLDYPSHCKQVTVIQFGKRIVLEKPVPQK